MRRNLSPVSIIGSLLLLALAFLSIILALLDLLGILVNPPILEGRISVLSLLLLGVLLAYLVWEKRSLPAKIGEQLQDHSSSEVQTLERLEQEVQKGLEQTIRAVQGGPMTILTDMEEVYLYVAHKMAKAQKSIDDLTWAANLAAERSETEEAAFQKYRVTIKAAAARTDLLYREVMSFPDLNRLDIASDLVDNANLYNYQLRYYNITPQEAPPLLVFMVIDSREVILAFYRDPNVAGVERHLAIQHPEIVDLFQDYYNLIWERAEVIKRIGKPGDLKILQDIRKRLPGD